MKMWDKMKVRREANMDHMISPLDVRDEKYAQNPNPKVGVQHSK